MKAILKEVDMSAFQEKKDLNPKIFDVENEKMKIDVRKSLLSLSKIYYTFLRQTVEIQDILLVGSMANYNWSDYSDIDIKIILPFDEIHKENIVDFFNDKKNTWLLEHNIDLFGYNVHLDVVDVENTQFEGGVYSILYDRWVSPPVFLEIQYDEEKVNLIVGNMLANFKKALKHRNNPSKFKDFMDKILDKSFQFKSKKEFSPENMAYKYLGRLGLFKKAKQMGSKALDYSLSVGHNNAELGKQARLNMGSNWVKNKDAYGNPDEDKDTDGYTDGISYSVHGAIYTSLRKASEATGESKSTIQYRVKSKNPKYSDYKVIYDR